LCATFEAVEKDKERQYQLELAKQQREAEEKQREYEEKQQDKQREHELAKERISVAAEKEQREHEADKLVQAKLAAEQATAKAKLEADSIT